MANDNVLAGMACPQCKSEESFSISVQIYGTLSISDMGYDISEIKMSDLEWEDTDACQCDECGFYGYVRDFIIPVQEDERLIRKFDGN